MSISIGGLIFSFNFDTINELSSVIDADMLTKLKTNINKLAADIKKGYTSIKDTTKTTIDSAKTISDSADTISKVTEIYDYFVTNNNPNTFILNDVNLKLLKDYRGLCYNWNRYCNLENGDFVTMIDNFSLHFGGVKLFDIPGIAITTTEIPQGTDKSLDLNAPEFTGVV